MITKTKFIKFIGLKVSPSRPDESQLDKINRFTRRKFTAEEMYMGQLRLAHNAIDRDKERFSDEVLGRFEQTIVRKTMLFDHAKYDTKNSAVGKFFDVQIETIPLAQAVEILGEDLVLPVGVNEVKILSPWFYIPVKGVSEETIVKIDAGIYDFASIGFRAETLVPVRDANGQLLYSEYRGAGRTTEATEGSLVYLGAQGGMSIKANKQPDTESDLVQTGLKPVSTTLFEGGKEMEKFLKMLSTMYGKNFTEENALDNIKALLDVKDAKILELQETIKIVKALEDKVKLLEPLEQKVKDLEPLAADGKAYRDSLVSDYVSLRAKLGEVAETPEAQGKVKAVVERYPVDFLKEEVKHLQKRVEEKFPCDPQLKGDDRRDKSGDTKSKNLLIPKD